MSFPFDSHSAAVSEFTLAMPCSDHAVVFKVTAQHGRVSTAVLCESALRQENELEMPIFNFEIIGLLSLM